MIHPTSEVHSKHIGESSTVWQYCIILKDSVIGEKCNINCYVFIENDVIIGDCVTIKPGVQLWDGLRIGNNVFIGPNVTFTNDRFPRSKQYPSAFNTTIIETGVSIGANSTIIGGITVGMWSMIGAGSVVTKNVQPFSLWYGNPARHRGYITKKGKILSLNLTDDQGQKYRLDDDEPVRHD